MFLLPISTDTSVRRTPWGNYGLIAVNVVVFLIQYVGESGGSASLGGLADRIDEGTLDASAPRLYEFFTYQFLHGGWMHLVGNMLFLWVFGTPVNAKMGHGPYVLFYLAGGVFAAAGYAWFYDDRMVGASGSIAAVTTAYLALFPRSHITMVYWWFFLGTFEIPSMVMIVFKMIIWDNVLIPEFVADESNVAFGAHLAGYAFGLAATAGMLALRLLPRDQFDIVALWRRWYQRQSATMGGSVPYVRPVARPVSVSDVSREPVPDPRQDRITDLRIKLAEALAASDRTSAARLFEDLMELDPRQILPHAQQLQMGNLLYTNNQLAQAAAAYEKYLSHYPKAPDAHEVELLLGIIYARDLQQYEVAEEHLRRSLGRFDDEKRQGQARHWLEVVARGLGRPFPEP